MNLKEGIFQEILLIPKYSGNISAENIFEDFRDPTEANFDDLKNRGIQIVFFKANPTSYENDIRNALDVYEFHFLDYRDNEDRLEEARSIFMDHFEGYRGRLGGASGFLVQTVRIENTGGEFIDYNTLEKTLVLQASFRYTREESGILS